MPPSDAFVSRPSHAPQLSLPPDPGRHQKQLAAIMDIAWAVSSTLDLDSLLPRVMHTVTEIIQADRTTFFVVDKARGELWSKVAAGAGQVEIRLRIGDGIAGAVAALGQPINLADAYADPRFSRAWDERSGYRTQSLLCVPVFDRHLSVVAVIQCLNKRGRRGFDAEDEDLLRCVCGQCAVALESAFLYEALLERNRALATAEVHLRHANAELALRYDLERLISEAAPLDQLLLEILKHACSVLGLSGAGLLYRADGSPRLIQHPPAEAASAILPMLLAKFESMTQPQVADSSPVGDDVAIAPGVGGMPRDLVTAPVLDSGLSVGGVQLASPRRADGDERWLLRMASLLAEQIARAIRVRREREERDREERLSLLGHSVGALLHDMRTPLTAVGGYADLMASEDDAAQRTQYVERIGRALEHMETMVGEVLAFARGQREVLIGKVYLHRFVEEVREMLAIETARAGMQLVVEMGYDGTARFDESKLKRVIFNLARNACQAMPPGGTFTWRISRVDETLVFECADDGPGIPQEMAGKLFESFATHGKAGGTGLGLAMAKKIVVAHSGRITCLSAQGKGACFRIELPV